MPELTSARRRARRAAAVGVGAAATVMIGRRARRNGVHPRPAASRNAYAKVRVASTTPEPPAELQTKSRWVVFLAYGLLAAATQALFVNYAPVTADAAQHFGVSISAIGWLSQVFPLIYVLLAIPAGIALDRFLRPSLVVGAVLTASGAFLRLVGDDYTWAFSGQVVAAVGQPFILNAIPGLAVAYLAEKHRATGIAVASSATFGGMVLGYLLGTFLPGESHIRTLTLISALIAMDAALCLIGALRIPPQANCGTTPAANGFRALRSAVRNRYVRRLCAVVAIPMGTFIALSTFVQPLLAPAGVSESAAGLILALTMIAGVIGCAVVPVWADQSGREVPVMGVAIVITAGACLHLALVPSTPMAFITLLGTGFVLLPALPIVLSLSERHAPEAESTAAGFIWMAGNLGGVLLATAVGVVVTRPEIAFAVLSAATLLALPALRWFRKLEHQGPVL